MPGENRGSCIRHLGLDICFDKYNYHDSLQSDQPRFQGLSSYRSPSLAPVARKMRDPGDEVGVKSSLVSGISCLSPRISKCDVTFLKYL